MTREISNLFFTGDETKQREFLMLKKAYDVLKDDEERKEYDKWRRCMSFVIIIIIIILIIIIICMNYFDQKNDNS
jgi:curved DNA-binding protein CbpA